uniref:Uncharacterized protein n=1 Tax=Arundo donax TaxID=35708 RepID=A0A0A9ECD5_ARUDO
MFIMIILLPSRISHYQFGVLHCCVICKKAYPLVGELVREIRQRNSIF